MTKNRKKGDSKELNGGEIKINSSRDRGEERRQGGRERERNGKKSNFRKSLRNRIKTIKMGFDMSGSYDGGNVIMKEVKSWNQKSNVDKNRRERKGD